MSHHEPDPGHADVPDEQISSRASGRPPEERSSEDPERQAQVILEDSEDRTEAEAEKSTES